ncbi:Nup133 N terminal like-domain-containing protein [Stachybotrys elegans]|uniref:Nup133 N terminal like-domain-containing protein n=1 Tax=Stachybotrys elegans TaxID=80388 RepID=A0A8K0SXW1_9HYPO|nr:Nup133 N terminal like-domain-containing protein [Stachybotrys elegans]
MFSPSVAHGGPATATRSRRRQRPKSQDDIVQQPKAKRQRLPLTEQTFVNPDAPQEMIQIQIEKPVAATPNGVIKHDNLENIDPTPRRDSSMRIKKPKHGDRAANKGDGSLVLTSTTAYTVSKLPALPDRIRSDWSGNQHADVFSSSGYALSLTSTHAMVWPYTSTSPSPETFTFTLPAGSKPSDPLPVGCLVSPSASSTEPGLVVVMAGTGKVVYWESISSAATFAFIKKDRSGVEYVINGMSSGEKVVAITNAESAGFILTFNTGRLAYMNVRDSHGRPSISVQFLRSNLTATTNGIFGSIRHAFSNLSLRGHIAAVRADRSARVGERNVVALTAKGRLQAWKIHRGGHEEPAGNSDIREELIAALHENDPATRDFPTESFEAIDFTFVPKGMESKYLELSRLSDAMGSDDSNVQHLLLLVGLTRRSESRYALVEVIQTLDSCHIGMIRPITSYSTPLSHSESPNAPRPRVYLPRPALVAFVVFERAAIVASIASPPDSPEAQLQSESHLVPASFEDVIDFQEDNVHEIVGSGFEEAAVSNGHEDTKLHRHKGRNPAVVLVVRGAGVVRIVTTDVDKFASDQSPHVSAKSKLEQAVFFGLKSDNPLMFGSRREIRFSREETAEAALEVSHEILSSTTSFISTLPAALEDNLLARSKALEKLMTHLNTIGADLDRKTRWSLLYNAEKMRVAHMLWKRHESFMTARSADDKKSLIAMIVEFIHQDQKHLPARTAGYVDDVRHWFVNDVFRIELLVAWAYEVIKTLYRDGLLDDSRVTLLMYEAIQINICTSREALDFRKNKLTFYGLGDEQLENGILPSGYEGLPEPWTGCQYVANNAKRLSELSWEWIKNRLLEEKTRITNKNDVATLEKIYRELADLIDVSLTSTLECALWADTVPHLREIARNFMNSYTADRYQKPVNLARAGKWEEAASIAEKHKSLDALALILLDHIEELEQRCLDQTEPRSVVVLRASKKEKLQACIAKYGQAFAFPMYDYLLERHGVDPVLSFELDKRGYKTKFLRSRPELARVSWINDVELEQDVGHAATTLLDLGLNKEQQVWNKKIELSMSKLALLAETETTSRKNGLFKPDVDEARNEEQMKKIDRELVSVRIQNQLYDLVSICTREAVDDAAALHFAMEAHSMNIPRRQRALYQIFEDGMKRLLRHEALDAMTLIDLLTLVYLSPDLRMEDEHPFWMALKVAESSCHPDERKEASKLIWRRLFIRDDWAKMNDTQLKGDCEVVERLSDTELFLMFEDCIRFQDPREPFRPKAPMDVAGAFTETLDRRFRDFDAGFQNKLLEAMRWEDKLLLQYIEKNRLSEWVLTTFDAARVDMNAQLDNATKEGAV